MEKMEHPDPMVSKHEKTGNVVLIHLLRVVVLGFILGPLVASAALFFDEPFLTLPLAFLIGIVFGKLGATGRMLPPKQWGRYLLPLVFFWLMLPAFFPFLLVLSLSGGLLTALRFLPAVYVLGVLIGFVVFEQRRKDRLSFSRLGLGGLCLLLAFPIAYMGYETNQDRIYGAKRGHGFERVGGFSSTNLKPYDPRVPDAVTPRLLEPSTFVIHETDSLPVMDGAEAAFPVYAAFAAACYPDLPPLSDQELKHYDYQGIRKGKLQFSNTIYAFRYLVDGNVDIFFGAHPSEQQILMAKEKGKELVLTPIAKEAFVFFVNEVNPVDGLISERIRDIYSGKVRNWKYLGGQDLEIIAFQRPENSGSQTIMHRFMGDVKMEAPLQDRYVGGMGGVVERASEYRNAPSAIGYSFRFFLNGLGKQPRIKTLAVDDILPTPEAIQSGEYPHVVHLYAVTIKDNPNPNIAPFLEWMRGEQGQELVEKIGYVRLH